MKIEIKKLIGGDETASVMRYLWGSMAQTIGRKTYESDHSILLIPTWIAYCEAPRSVALQMETHKKKDGFYLWMSSARPDRDAKAAEEYSRDQPVRFVMLFTAAAMKHISHLRMCSMAERPTLEFVWKMKIALKYMDDKDSQELARQMMPMCAYRNGICGEPFGCGNPTKLNDWFDEDDNN